MIDTATLRHFGLAKRGHYRSRLHDAFEHEIAAAVEDNALTAIIGPFGSGKTTLATGALRRATSATRALNIVHVQDPNRERQTIATVMNAAIYDLSTDNPRRDAEARARQFGRIIGERVVRQRQRVVIVIENAHRLHPQTLMALKDAREIKFADYEGPLFGVLLIGQGRLGEMLDRQPEIGHRTTRVEMTEDAGWMSALERTSYVEAVYPGVCDPATAARLASVHTTPLALDAALGDAMREARRAGYTRDDGRAVVDERTVQLSIQELAATVDVSAAELARLAGVPKSTAHDALKRGDDHPASPALREALGKISASSAQSTPTMSKVA